MARSLSDKHSFEYDEDSRPIITTERLILRPLSVEKGDAESLVWLLADNHLRRWFGMRPLKTIAEAEAFIERYSSCLHAVTEKGKDKLIGLVQSSFCFERCGALIGYCLSKEYEGKGYMTEAVLAIEDYVFSHWGYWGKDGAEDVKDIYAHVFVGNDASRRVLDRCGFHFVDSQENVYNPYGLVDDEDTFCTTVGDFEWIMRNAA